MPDSTRHTEQSAEIGGRPLTAAERVAAPPRYGESQLARVLDLDESLGRLLQGARLALARTQLVGRTLALDKGEWDVSSLSAAGPMCAGLLLVGGFVARELLMDSHVSIELFGPGDLLRPWGEESSVLPIDARWNVLSPARAVVLGVSFTARMRAFPEVAAELDSRLHQRAQRLAETQAISQATPVAARLHAMLWHLAERWGRVSPSGIIVPLALSHRMLSELVGARRPTVTAAVAELVRRGTIERREDGSWVLLDPTPPGRAVARQRLISTRRRLIKVESAARPASRAS